MKIFLNSLFFTFLLSDIFIFFFNKIINFIDINPIGSTELYLGAKYEIQIYVCLMTLFVLLIFLYRKLSNLSYLKYFQSNNRFKPLIQTAKWLITILLIIVFVIQLGEFPLRQDFIVNKIFIFYYFLGILTLISAFSFIYFFWNKHSFFKKIFFISIILLIAGITFISKLPIYFHDFSFFLGPILEIAKGKTIFTQIFSRYSFLGVLILGYLYKFSLFNPLYFPILIWLLYIVQYFVSFYLVLKISNSVVLSLMMLFSMLTVNFYSLMHFPSMVPEIGPLRWLPLVFSLYILYLFKDFKSKKFILALALLSFFTIDTGIYLIVAYCASLAILFLKNQISLKKILILISFLLLSWIIVFTTINIINIILGYQLINLKPVYFSLRSISKSYFLMIPIGNQSYFWLIILVYFTSLNQIFKNDKQESLDNILLFSTNLMALTVIYFVGESHPHNLLNLSLFFILNVSILIAKSFRNNKSLILKSFLLFIFFMLFIIYPGISRNISIKDNISNQISRLDLNKPFEPEIISALTIYKPEINLIKSNLRQKEIVIISPDDTYLFYLLKNKISLIDTLPQQVLNSEYEENRALKKVFSVCPKQIAVDCRILNKCEDYVTLNSAHNPVEQSFQLEKKFSTSILKKIENKCQLKYLPTICTKKLCIVVEAK